MLSITILPGLLVVISKQARASKSPHTNPSTVHVDLSVRVLKLYLLFCRTAQEQTAEPVYTGIKKYDIQRKSTTGGHGTLLVLCFGRMSLKLPNNIPFLNTRLSDHKTMDPSSD